MSHEGVCRGPFVDKAPDIVLCPPRGLWCRAEVTRASHIKEGVGRGGYHNMNGISLAYGRDMKGRLKIADAELYDIAPMIQNVFGFAIASDMDGRVLKEIFEEGSELARREIAYHEAEAEDEEGRIKVRVKGLKAFGKM